MEYLKTEDSPESGAILVSVTSTPTVEQDRSDLSMINSNLLSENAPLEEKKEENEDNEVNEVQSNSAATLTPATDDAPLDENTPTNAADLSNKDASSMDISSIDTESVGTISEIDRVPSIEYTVTAEVIGGAGDVTVEPISSTTTTVTEGDSFPDHSSMLSNAETATDQHSSGRSAVFSDIELSQSSPSMDTGDIMTPEAIVDEPHVTITEQPMQDYERMMTDIENSSLKRKEAVEIDISECLIKKRRTIQEMPSAEGNKIHSSLIAITSDSNEKQIFYDFFSNSSREFYWKILAF